MPEKPEKRMRTVCSCVGIPEACRPSRPATCASLLPPRMFDFSICWPSEEGKKKRERRCNCCWPKVNDVNEAAAPRCLPPSLPLPAAAAPTATIHHTQPAPPQPKPICTVGSGFRTHRVSLCGAFTF